MPTKLTCNRIDVQAFKAFLESIAYGDDAELRSSRKGILLEYLKHQNLSHNDGPPTEAFDLIKTWSFAAQSNNEALFAAVTAVLVLFLKTISRHVEFRDAGRNICYLILQKDQLKVLERGLSVQKSKDHVISPSIRLLSEIVGFDGGYSASRVYRTKDITLKRLDTFLGLRQEAKGVGSSSRRKASIRDNALRYLFANLRLQDHSAKIELLSNGKIFRSVFQDIKGDSPSIVREVLKVMTDDVLRDEKIPRRIKGKLFTDHVLGSIATLYTYRSGGDDDAQEEEQGQEQDKESIPGIAHAFLLSVCTNPVYGILLKQGVQLSGADGEEYDVPSDLGGNHPSISLLSKRSRKRTAIRNNNVASFLQTLRPHANGLQRDLLLATFQAAPELISDYFFRKRTFSFEPKLTATWIGSAAFLLSTIQLPFQGEWETPEGHKSLPVSVPDIIETIIPLPLTPKIVIRCFHQSVNVIRFFAVRLLSAAFDKLAQILAYFRSRSRAARGPTGKIWDSTAAELVEEFGQRCPDMNHVIGVFRSCTSEATVLREASARLLSLYYRYLPQKALEQKLDVSGALSAALKDAMSAGPHSGDHGLHPLVFTHLIEVAKCSPDMRWWQKPGMILQKPFFKAIY